METQKHKQRKNTGELVRVNYPPLKGQEEAYGWGARIFLAPLLFYSDFRSVSNAQR